MNKLTLYPTQKKFITSKATIVWLIGPQGEGKTFTGIWSLIHHATKQPEGQTMKCAIVRDTFENIRRNTIPSIKDALEVNPAVARKFHFSNGGKYCVGPFIEIDFLGIDDLAGLAKLQGGEYAFIWLEEPAPILAKANSGLPEEVFDVALSRVARQKNSIPRLQITMNPGDEEHWTYHKAIEDPINPLGGALNYADDGMDIIRSEIINIPYGENKTLTNFTRASVKTAYKNRPDLWARYVDGDWSFVQGGIQVVPEYNEKLHRAKVILDPMPNRTVYRFWDAGLNPTCVFYQTTPRGRLFILDTLRGDNMGMRQFLKLQVIPLMNRRYSEIEDWEDIGDPNCLMREQSDSETSAALIINEALDTSFIGGPDLWAPRREAVKEIFTRMVDGEPMILLSSHEGILHRALRGGWSYKKDNAGNVLKDKPIKNIHSHPGDALSYGIGKLHPWLQKKKPSMGGLKKQRRRAAGYAVSRRKRISEIGR